MVSPPTIERRHLLLLASAAAATAWLPRSAWSQVRVPADAFALGVASGSPAHDSVVLWTRLVGELPAEPLTVRWEIAHDDQFQRIVQSGQHEALPQLAHSVHVEAQGLAPDRWYFYRFMAGAAVSAVGRTRTLPAADAAVAKLRLAYASCQRWEHGYYSAWRHMREERLDLVVFLGDYIYEYPSLFNSVRPTDGGWVLTLDDYRRRHALHKSDSDLQAMHAACPWLVTWDDHEVQNDHAGLAAGSNGPRVPDFGARRAAAYQAYYEHMPLRAAALTRALGGLASGAELRLYSQHRFGQLANILLLDDRQYRDRQVCTRLGSPGSGLVDPDACEAWNDPARTLLGAEQERWLEAALDRSRARWTVIGQQTMFGALDARPGPGRQFWNDGWDGYGAARSRVTQSLQRHQVANPVLLGGDMHENWVGQVKADYARPDSASIGVEFCGTSITSRAGRDTKIPERLAENPHFIFADAQRRGYGVAEFTPGGLTTTLRVIDDVSRPDARVETLATFAVEAGRRQVEKV